MRLVQPRSQAVSGLRTVVQSLREVRNVMINGMHVILYGRHAGEVRKFLGDVLEWRSIDAGDGWPTFAAPPLKSRSIRCEDQPSHEIYLMCSDVAAAVAKLGERGVGTEGPIADRGWGLLATAILPGGERIGLYEPRHRSALKPTELGTSVNVARGEIYHVKGSPADPVYAGAEEATLLANKSYRDMNV